VGQPSIQQQTTAKHRHPSKANGYGHHLDLHASGGAGATDRSVSLATRIERVDAEAKRLADLGATITGALRADGIDHYAMGMKDPEGNEFDVN
jgi:glyoxalase superfamily protein